MDGAGINLGDINTEIALGIQVAGVLIPLAKGLVAKIEGIGTKTTTITFTDLVAADAAELDAIQQLSTDDLTAVNAELVRLGRPPIAPLDPPAPPTAVGPENSGK